MDQQRIVEIIRDKKYHPYYERTVELAELYMKLCTGKGAETLLKQFNPNEEKELFDQRVKLTQIVTPAICHTITTPHHEMTRVTPLHKGVFHSNQDAQDNIERVLQSYYGGAGIDGYLCEKLVPLASLDPNAFIIVREDEAHISYAHQNVDFNYKNNVLQHLVTRNEIMFLEQGVQKKGFRYDIYEGTNLTTYTRVAYRPGLPEFEEEGFYRTISELYEIEEFDLGVPFIPCLRAGVKPDGQTMGETMVSMIDPAVPYLLKSVKTISELDINVSLHAFLQKIAYEPACDHCIKGTDNDGNECATCKGTGFLEANSGQTAITLRLPDDPADVIKIQDLVHYVQLPIDIPKFLDELTEKYERKAVKAVYVTEVFERSQVTATATEKNLEEKAKNNTLYPLGQKYSYAYRFVSEIIAHYKGFDNFVIKHEFPKNLAVQSREALVNEMKIAREANLSGYFFEALEENYAQMLFADQPDELQRIRVKKRFNPFKGKTKDEILTLIAGELVDKDTITLYVYFDRIFEECEQETERVWFYKLPYEQIKRQLDIKVKGINDTQGGSQATGEGDSIS